MATPNEPLTLEKVFNWARSGHESDKVYRFLFLRPDDLFTVPRGRKWSIAHQVVFNGDTNLLKRILALYSDHQIDIYTLSVDGKTLLDVANEQRRAYPEMYNHVTRLFLQEDLIRAAKSRNWNRVNEILQKNPELANEKPVYSTYFLIHYVIQNGDENILRQLLDRFHLQTNVLTVDNETPLALARRLNLNGIASVLAATQQPNVNLRTLRTPGSVLSRDTRRDEPRSESVSTITTDVPSVSSTASSPLPYPTEDPFPVPHFSSFLLDLSGSGSLTVEKRFSFPSMPQPTLPSTYLGVPTPTAHHTGQPTGAQASKVDPSSSIITPAILASDDELRKHFTCPLAQRVFVDPVIANDGQTYERQAISEWVNLYHCSPTTGAPMEPIFKDNTELKEIIEAMRTQS